MSLSVTHLWECVIPTISDALPFLLLKFYFIIIIINNMISLFIILKNQYWSEVGFQIYLDSCSPLISPLTSLIPARFFDSRQKELRRNHHWACLSFSVQGMVTQLYLTSISHIWYNFFCFYLFWNLQNYRFQATYLTSG
jgi:hypothetical protein